MLSVPEAEVGAADWTLVDFLVGLPSWNIALSSATAANIAARIHSRRRWSVRSGERGIQIDGRLPAAPSRRGSQIYRRISAIALCANSPAA